ncbi:MAG: hypothetical protein H0T89_03230 [Deltaproteobacteria bacterium]|nr:hypothetical protein [Deltaproteobacteria bacterium]MDQ3300186.1 hypothetical protein [Myxococcota bacterium]
MATIRSTLLVLAMVLVGCGKQDNSEATDQASKQLREAQDQVNTNTKDLTANEQDIEKRKRELATEQQELADKQKRLEEQQRALGSAQQTLAGARVAYAAAVKERLAKLDAALATLSRKTDAKARDAAAGLRARRDQLVVMLDAMAGTADPDWNKYTKDVDTTFDAIERDLSATD